MASGKLSKIPSIKNGALGGHFFIDNALLRPNDLLEAYHKPTFTQFLNLVHIGFSHFPKNWEDRKAFYTEEERLVCVVEGTELFALVSPIYTQNIYVGLFE
jgi:hypothetical protein